MVATVRSYHPDVKRTAITVDGLVDGTAFFPGGQRTLARRGPRWAAADCLSRSADHASRS